MKKGILKSLLPLTTAVLVSTSLSVLATSTPTIEQMDNAEALSSTSDKIIAECDDSNDTPCVVICPNCLSEFRSNTHTGKVVHIEGVCPLCAYPWEL